MGCNGKHESLTDVFDCGDCAALIDGTSDLLTVEPTEAPVWYSDSAHAWLRVPLAYVESSGYIPTPYSYRSADYAYLEEDRDAPAYLRHVGIWDGERGSLPQFADNYRDGERHDVRGLPQWGGDSKMWREVIT